MSASTHGAKRQKGAALTLAKQDEIIVDVNAEVSNKGNYDGTFIKDDDVQVQQGHYYLLDVPEPTVW